MNRHCERREAMTGVMQIDGVLLWRKRSAAPDQPCPISRARSAAPPD